MKELIAAIKNKRILVIGDAMLDHYIWGDAHRISPEAPVPVVAVERDTYAAGGAANVALNLCALGARVRLVTRIGRDADGRRLRELLVAEKIRLSAPIDRAGLPTIVKTRIMCRHQQICRLDREGAAEDYALDRAPDRENLDAEIDQADAVVLSDYAKGVVTTPLVEHVVDRASRKGILAAIDPKPRSNLDFRDVGLMTPNRQEALQLAGLFPDPTAPFPADLVCARIHARYRPRCLVITLGAEGMLVSPDEHSRHPVPTCAREVFDVSGAGDTVIASLTLAMAGGAAIDRAVRFANIAAGIVVGKLGAATATPGEILEFEGDSA